MNKLIGFPRKPDATAAEQVRDWTRTRFALGDVATVMVAEVVCAVPGCPPLETVVAFWTETDKRHHFKIFKTVAHVTEDDLPPAFMKNALIALEGFECDCC